jgi:hypothetical protein
MFVNKLNRNVMAVNPLVVISVVATIFASFNCSGVLLL